MSEPKISESEVRALRDAVFLFQCTDAEWEKCRANWMRQDSVQWLQEHAKVALSEPGI